MQTIFDYVGIGGLGIIVLSVFIEISPIKLNPIRWLGNILNKDILEATKRTEKKLDEHIAQSYRNKILQFMDDIVEGKRKTKEQWNEVVVAISSYENYCQDNKIHNGLCTQASEFLLEEYKQRLKEKKFCKKEDYL